ncbi:hypothetical protein C7H19_13895 [Aphanothece hegewaldii CCALA 016]|uniref:Uncharacterized protein n=1 Tax=Aphanothece hegewaldii CCALA 016 TaxID=2107694 RepID=A0A2T1LWM3_9CHRO|nr:hypothetical protein [Aphanothece hegewaldii]PSF36294.1 hypothetical protein C7H19_13895 [Aphanothece hegewaldii CCALA 016]
MSHAQLLQSAKRGDTEAISILLNRCLQVRRVSLVETNLNENCLELKLVSPKVPNQYKLIPFLRDEISSLGIELLEKVKIYALTDITSEPAWETSIILEQDWSTAQNLADAVVKGKRSIYEENESEIVADISSEEENLIEEQTEVENISSVTETIEENLSITEEVPQTLIQPPQKSSLSLFPLVLSFVIGLLTGLSIGYFFSMQKASISEPTIYTTPQQ